MKTTKRILALITALVLCLAPMALMVGAAVVGETISPMGLHCNCPNPTYTLYDHGPFVTNADGSIKENSIGSALVCYESWYKYSRMQCSDCHIIFYNYNVTRAEFTHPTVYKVEIDGEMHDYCPKCGYTG